VGPSGLIGHIAGEVTVDDVSRARSLNSKAEFAQQTRHLSAQSAIGLTIKDPSLNSKAEFAQQTRQ